MKMYRYCVWGTFLALGIVALMLVRCHAVKPVREGKLQVMPDKIALSPALIKEPVRFKGAGFLPGEIVVVEMVLLPGVHVTGVTEGENVGLAYATADDHGDFQAAMAPTATLNWFFQVGWTPEAVPDFKQAKPLPPGTYVIKATGMDSRAVGKAILEILTPPKKPS